MTRSKRVTALAGVSAAGALIALAPLVMWPGGGPGGMAYLVALFVLITGLLVFALARFGIAVPMAVADGALAVAALRVATNEAYTGLMLVASCLLITGAALAVSVRGGASTRRRRQLLRVATDPQASIDDVEQAGRGLAEVPERVRPRDLLVLRPEAYRAFEHARGAADTPAPREHAASSADASPAR